MNNEKVEKLNRLKNILFSIMIICVISLLVFRNLELDALADYAYAVAPIAGICVIVLNRVIRKELKRSEKA
ncbi:hypothetical protein [Paraliobacillus sediminis]|uniref:hypothetical protein n=1 Tax=Paraliobacillus sediminis TaxID=1885916 RepID=UPI000E3CB9B8|nr:hypothetical protein [Paraliobacillus sediminis]